MAADRCRGHQQPTHCPRLLVCKLLCLTMVMLSASRCPNGGKQASESLLHLFEVYCRVLARHSHCRCQHRHYGGLRQLFLHGLAVCSAADTPHPAVHLPDARCLRASGESIILLSSQTLSCAARLHAVSGDLKGVAQCRQKRVGRPSRLSPAQTAGRQTPTAETSCSTTTDSSSCRTPEWALRGMWPPATGRGLCQM